MSNVVVVVFLSGKGREVSRTLQSLNRAPCSPPVPWVLALDSGIINTSILSLKAEGHMLTLEEMCEDEALVSKEQVSKADEEIGGG